MHDSVVRFTGGFSPYIYAGNNPLNCNISGMGISLGSLGGFYTYIYTRKIPPHCFMKRAIEVMGSISNQVKLMMGSPSVSVEI